MSEPRWIRFREDGVLRGQKTNHWTVLSKESGAALGSVSWYGPWRCYAFTPTVDMVTIFEHRCLRDIAAFCESATANHRAGLKGAQA